MGPKNALAQTGAATGKRQRVARVAFEREPGPRKLYMKSTSAEKVNREGEKARRAQALADVSETSHT